ncbi:MAG: hypothetical protein ACRC62_23325 [Microcoleus sp.]
MSKIKIYQGDRRAGKTTKLLSLCKEEDIFIVFSSVHKIEIKYLRPSLRCFTILELINGKTVGLNGDFYFDDVDFCLQDLTNKALWFGFDGEIERIDNKPKKQSGEVFFIDSDKNQRDIAAIDYARIHDFYVVCPGIEEIDNLMSIKDYIGLRFPLTYDEFLSRKYHSNGVDGFYLHEAHYLLRYLTKGQRIAAVSLTA